MDTHWLCLKNKYLNHRMSKHWKNNGEVFFVVNLFVLEFVLNTLPYFFFFSEPSLVAILKDRFEPR